VTVRRQRLEGRGYRVGRFFGFLRWPLCFVRASLRSEVLQNLEYAGFKVAEVGGGEERLGEDVISRCNGSLYERSVGVSVCAKLTLHSRGTAEGLDSR
jgi:hypothetical protein